MGGRSHFPDHAMSGTPLTPTVVKPPFIMAAADMNKRTTNRVQLRQESDIGDAIKTASLSTTSATITLRDKPLADSVKQTLVTQGYDVTVAEDGGSLTVSWAGK